MQNAVTALYQADALPAPTSGRPSRACILGASLDVGNRGVSALGVSVAQLLARISPGTEIAFHYSHNRGGVKTQEGPDGALRIDVRNCRKSPRSAPGEHVAVIILLALLYRVGITRPARRNTWLRSLLEADFIGEIRGGDSFSDIYGLRRFAEGCLPLLSAALMRRRYVMLPQTYGPFRSRAAHVLASWLLKRADAILTRDRNCEAMVLEMSGRPARFCPDVAFTLNPRKPDQLRIHPAGLTLDDERLLVGVNVSGLLYMGGYTRSNMFGLRADYPGLMNALVERLLESTPATILLIPHVFGSEQEVEACAALQDALEGRYPGRVYRLADALTERELKWLIGRTDFFIGSRMHACIAALSQGVPAVGLAYSDKFLGVFESAGVGRAILDLRNADADAVLEQTLTALHDRHVLRAQLEARVPVIRTEVVRTFEELLFGEAGRRRPA